MRKSGATAIVSIGVIWATVIFSMSSLQAKGAVEHGSPTNHTELTTHENHTFDIHEGEKDMKPTDILKAEHRVIEQILNALEKISQEGLREHKLNGDSARLALEFFRGFADQCHHGKEEVHLFPMMESKGFSRDNGPTGVMIHEHEQGRQFIREMDKSIPGAERGDAEALKAFASNATGYIGMLREHIQKEDHCLFSMADNAMNAEDQERLSEQFEKVEAEEMGEGTHEKFIGIAQTLMKRHGLETEIPEGAKSCCHHH